MDLTALSTKVNETAELGRVYISVIVLLVSRALYIGIVDR